VARPHVVILNEVKDRDTGMGRLRVIGAEGLIAFKLQGHVNDPRRLRDLDDIRLLLRANRASLDMVEVRRYFAIFDREALLDEILAEPDR
jgi:hypothetical protein